MATQVVRRRVGGGSGKGLLDNDPTPRARLAAFDLFPKVEAQVEVHTPSGGAVTVVCLVVMAVLVVSEVSVLFRSDFRDRIALDGLLRERLQINLDITFHALACAQVELAAMDTTGEHQVQADSAFDKTPILDPTMRSSAADCKSCFGAGDEGRCCNSCAELVEAYIEKGWDAKQAVDTAPQCAQEKSKGLTLEQIGELATTVQVHHGCRLAGQLKVNKVAGNFHVALGHGRSVNGRMIYQFAPSQLPFYNTSHTINSLWFGDRELPGSTSSEQGSRLLDGRTQVVDPHKSKTGAFQYYLEVVPTDYRGRRYYQFTSLEQFKPVGDGTGDGTDEGPGAKKDEMHKGHGHAQPAVISTLPGVFFVYEMSPFAVIRTDRTASLTEFFTNLLAIMGGTFALSKFVDGFLNTLLCKVRGEPR